MKTAVYINQLKSILWPKATVQGYEDHDLIAPLNDFQKTVGIERNRVNRNGGKFTIIVFRVNEFQNQQKPILKLVESLSRRTRVSDQIGWYGQGQLGLILPETSTLGAKRILNDIYNGQSNGLPELPVDFYTYPRSTDPSM